MKIKLELNWSGTYIVLLRLILYIKKIKIQKSKKKHTTLKKRIFKNHQIVRHPPVLSWISLHRHGHILHQ